MYFPFLFPGSQEMKGVNLIWRDKKKKEETIKTAIIDRDTYAVSLWEKEVCLEPRIQTAHHTQFFHDT